MIVPKTSALWPIMLDAVFGKGHASVLTARTNGFIDTLRSFESCSEHEASIVDVLERPGTWDGEPDPGVAITFRTIVDAMTFAERRFDDGEEAVIIRACGSVTLLFACGDRIRFAAVNMDADETGNYSTIPGSGDFNTVRFTFLD